MIYFTFVLSWPWTRYKESKDYLVKNWKISKHKNFAIQFSRLGNRIIGIELDVTPTGQSHGRVAVTIDLFGHMLMLEMYDSRHWNYKTNTWENEDNEISTTSL